LFKRQWATNIKKFQGIQLPGGVTIDGDKLYFGYLDELYMPQGKGLTLCIFVCNFYCMSYSHAGRWVYLTGKWRGQRYMGTFRNGLPHGGGEEQYPSIDDGRTYDGGSARGNFVRNFSFMSLSYGRIEPVFFRAESRLSAWFGLHMERGLQMHGVPWDSR
jgi:hypothetical protein